MAEVVAIQLKVDSGQSVQEVQKLEDAIKDVQKTTNSSNVEEKFNALNMSIEQGSGSVEDLRKAIKSYQTIALASGRTSPIGKQALQRSADLKDKLTDLDNEVNRLSQDGKNLQGALQIGQGVMAGYQGFIGVTALLGTENEELMKTMVKLQGAMSVVQAIEQIRLATEKESQAVGLIGRAKLKATIVLQKLYALSVGGGTKAMKLFKTALISTGLGALVVLLGTIIAKWDDWKDSIMGMIETAFKPFIKVLQWMGVIESDLEKQRREYHEASGIRLKEEAKAIEDKYDYEIALAKANGEDTEALERAKLQAVIENTDAQIQRLIDAKHQKGELNEDELDEFVDLQDAKRKALEQMEIFQANIDKAERDRRRKAYEERKKQEEKERDERLKRERSLLEELQDAIIDSMVEGDAKKIAQTKLQHERELNAIIEKYGENTELEKQLRLNQAQELRDIDKEIYLKDQEQRDELRDADIEMANFFAEQDDAMDKERVNKSIDLTKKELKVVEDSEKAKREARVLAFEQASQISNNIASLFAQNEKVQKANALAQIGIDTAKAISSLMANSEGNPLNLLTGGLAGIVQFTSGIARIVANVGQAKRLLMGGSGVSVPSSSSGGGSITVPRGGASDDNINTGNTNFTNPVTTNKVVLVESELQAMQERRNEVLRVATI